MCRRTVQKDLVVGIERYQHASESETEGTKAR